MPMQRMIGRLGLALCLAMGIADSARAETITVTHWGGQFYGAPYAVAMEKGFFRHHASPEQGEALKEAVHG